MNFDLPTIPEPFSRLKVYTPGDKWETLSSISPEDEGLIDSKITN